MTWNSAEFAPPNTDRLVEVTTPGGDVRKLRYDRGLWWLPDRSMYVYFSPVQWRDIEEKR